MKLKSLILQYEERSRLLRSLALALACLSLCAFLTPAASGAGPAPEWPAWLVLQVELNGELQTIELERQSVRGPGFEVLVQTKAGYQQLDPGPVRTYLGSLQGEPESLVSAVAATTGVTLAIQRASGERFTAHAVGSGRANATPRKAGDETAPDGDMVEPAAEPVMSSALAAPEPLALAAVGVSPLAAVGSPSTSKGSNLYQLELGIDADSSYYALLGSDVAATQAKIEENIAWLNGIYRRDALVDIVIGRLIIRTDPATDPYAGKADQYARLYALRDEWNNNQPGSNHDLANLVTTNNIPGPSMSFSPGLCTTSRYLLSAATPGSSDFHVISHEMGHSFNVRHYQGTQPEGFTIMLPDGPNPRTRFSGPDLDVMFAYYRYATSCLVNVGPTAVALDPYAWMDLRSSQPGEGPLTLDVLANDHDGNGDTLTLATFDATTRLGGNVTRSVGTGPGGRDQLIYTPPASVRGFDRFTYTAADGAGHSAVGNVMVDLETGPLDAYWPLNETTGALAANSVDGADAVAQNGFSFDTGTVAGVFGNAAKLDGVNDGLRAATLFYPSGAFTFALWFKPETTLTSASPAARLLGWEDDYIGGAPWVAVNSRGDGKVTLTAVVNGVQFTYAQTTTTSWTAGTWYHLAFSYDGTQFRVYVNGALQSTVVAPGAVMGGMLPVLGAMSTGYQPFNGSLDDIRVYNVALDAAGVTALLTGGAPLQPAPFPTQTNVPPYAALRWIPNAKAVTHDVFLGADATAVANATIASAEYKGRISRPLYQGDRLNPNTQYYWKVTDIAGDNSSVTSAVWSFTTGENGATYETFYEAENTNQNNYPPRSYDSWFRGYGWSTLHANSQSITWRGFAHYAGLHDLKIHYTSYTNPQPATLSVNGQAVANLTFTTTANWTTPQDITLTGVQLNQGFNLVTVTTGSGNGAPRVDYLKVIDGAPPSPPTWTVLSSDNFETGWGSYVDGGGDCNRVTTAGYVHQGSYAAQIQDDSGVASSFYYSAGRDVQTPGYTQIKVEFWFKATSMETGEDFWVQYWDGATWRTVASYAAGTAFVNGVYYHPTVLIDKSSYAFPTGMKLRFMADASDNSDKVYIDEVVVSAK